MLRGVRLGTVGDLRRQRPGSQAGPGYSPKPAVGVRDFPPRVAHVGAGCHAVYEMWFVLVVWVGSLAIAALVAWWVHRHQRDIDGYYTRDYREPFVFQWHGPL